MRRRKRVRRAGVHLAARHRVQSAGRLRCRQTHQHGCGHHREGVRRQNHTVERCRAHGAEPRPQPSRSADHRRASLRQIGHHAQFPRIHQGGCAGRLAVRAFGELAQRRRARRQRHLGCDQHHRPGERHHRLCGLLPGGRHGNRRGAGGRHPYRDLGRGRLEGSRRLHTRQIRSWQTPCGARHQPYDPRDGRLPDRAGLVRHRMPRLHGCEHGAIRQILAELRHQRGRAGAGDERDRIRAIARQHRQIRA